MAVAQKPFISVILIIGDKRIRSAGALDSILNQDGITENEVIVVDVSMAEPIQGSEHPNVTLIHASKDQHFGTLRALAVRKARGEVVAFLEEHARAQPGWLCATKKAFKTTDWAGVGGEVHNPHPEVKLTQAIYLMNYLTWRPPAKWGPSELLPGQNSAYRKDALLKLGENLDDYLLTEIIAQWKLQEMGLTLGTDPAVKFNHINEYKLISICAGYYHWHRCFGAIRKSAFEWPWYRSLLHALAFPIIPIVRAFRAFRYLVQERPDDLNIFFRSLPVILVAQTAASVGMAVGLIFGVGDAKMKFTEYEYTEIRSDEYPNSV